MPAAPSMDRQLNPQESMASLPGRGGWGRLGHWEGRGLKNCAELSYAVQKSPGLGTKPEINKFMQGFRS